MSSVLLVAPLLAAQVLSQGHTREIRAHGVVVHAAAREHDGVTTADLDVRAHGKTQRIVVTSRDVPAQTFVQSIEIVDANFDGAADVTMAHEVFLWDGRGFHDQTPLARDLAQLEHATFDARARTVTTRSAGPTNPSRVTYAIEGGALREIASCRFVNPTDPRVGTLVRTVRGRATYTKTRLAPAEADPCSTY